MINAHIDTTTDLDGSTVVLARFDLEQAEIPAAAHAVAAAARERYANTELSVDDVLAMRDLTALSDELSALAALGGHSPMALAPARLMAFRDALEAYVAVRDDAEWVRPEDYEPLTVARRMLDPLADLCADAVRAALAAATPA